MAEVLKENHPLFEYLKKYNWKEVIDWGELLVRFRDGKPTLITIKNEYKLD